MNKFAIALPTALLAGAVFAQSMTHNTDHIRARDIIANPVYTTNSYVEGDWDLDVEVTDIASTYTEIGEIEDILLSPAGEVVGIVAEVGGFLDIGDKHVMLPVEDLRTVYSAGEPYYVTRLTEEQLEERDGMDESWMN